MDVRRAPIALAILTAFMLAGCSLDRWSSVEPGEYIVVPDRGIAKANALREIQKLEIDRDKRLMVFTLVDGTEITASFVTRNREAWPSGCPANINSTRMEVLDIVEDPLTIKSTKAITFSHPILVRDCPPDPMRAVLREDGAIGGSGGACTHPNKCIFFGRRATPTSFATPITRATRSPTSTPAESSAPTPSPAPTDQLAFINGSAYKVMDIANIDLPAIGENECCPAFSPDGQKIVFGTRSMTQDIYVMNVDGSSLKRLSSLRVNDGDGPFPDPTWSPDGRQIAFVNYDYGLYVVNADGSNLTRLDHKGLDPAWSPDGQHLVFTSYDHKAGVLNEIGIINRDGSGFRQLTNHEALDQRPAWSPDGRYIAFVSDRDGNDEIYVINSDGRDLRRLTDHNAADWGPVWSPDGQYIVFTSDRDGHSGIYVMNRDGTDQRWLMDTDAPRRWRMDTTRVRFISSAR
jgi:TolB protein